MYQTKNEAMESHKAAYVREGNGCWFVKSPLTGVEFVERSMEAVEARLCWFYRSKKVIGY